jgi:hypothetical protein
MTANSDTRGQPPKVARGAVRFEYCVAEVVDGVSGLVAAVSGPLGGCALDWMVKRVHSACPILPRFSLHLSGALGSCSLKYHERPER